ncbi:MAG: galactosamine-6-phosphate isomerase [Planctomycetota bacterium]|nr:MAG: galactosamine-6-phosphate isomerase [Planctomycetota bacterium]
MIRTHVFEDYESLSQAAAAWTAERLRRAPEAIVCLAAGATPTRTYQLLAERGAGDPSLFQRRWLLKLDEWGGLPLDHPATCDRQLRTLLVTPLGLEHRYVAFDSQPLDPQAEVRRIAAWLADHGPIGLCALGLGVNGHLGFNEPASALQPHAHVAELSAESLSHAMVRQCAAPPQFGLTLGMADLLQSHEVLLLASGAAKRAPLRRLLAGRLETQFPASLLHLHRSVTLLCDRQAWPAEESPDASTGE